LKKAYENYNKLFSLIL